MKTAMVFLVLFFTFTLFSQTDCFTAGIGNVDGKRQFNKVSYNVCYPPWLADLYLLLLPKKFVQTWKLLIEPVISKYLLSLLLSCT